MEEIQTRKMLIIFWLEGIIIIWWAAGSTPGEGKVRRMCSSRERERKKKKKNEKERDG